MASHDAAVAQREAEIEKLERLVWDAVYALLQRLKNSILSRKAARQYPVFGILAGKENRAEPLAGKSTLNRMELGTGINDRYTKITFWKEAVDELLVNAFIESHEEAPAEIVPDMDTTDMPLHGKQEGRFFHGYYDAYCYLPLYVFCGDHVLCARMREASHDAALAAGRRWSGS
jgi:hypothetical protein